MPSWLDVSIFGLTFFVMLVGLFGLVVPIFPGIVVIWLAAFGYGLVVGFVPWGIVIFVLISAIMLSGVVVDNFLMGAKARQEGASWWSIVVALVAGIMGTFLFPPIGGLVTAPLGILIVEYARARDWQKAVQATRGLALGCGWAFVIRFGLGVLMIGLWLVWAFFV